MDTELRVSTELFRYEFDGFCDFISSVTVEQI